MPYLASRFLPDLNGETSQDQPLLSHSLTDSEKPIGLRLSQFAKTRQAFVVHVLPPLKLITKRSPDHMRFSWRCETIGIYFGGVHSIGYQRSPPCPKQTACWSSRHNRRNVEVRVSSDSTFPNYRK